MLALAGALAAGVALLPEGPPQLGDATKPFFQADPMSGGVEDALLLCRVDVVGQRSWDTFSAIDMRVTIAAGRRAPVVVWGPEDRSSVVVGFPGFSAKAGERLGFVVEDRDVTENELVARGSTVFQGTPFRLDLDDTQIECRALPHETTAARARPLVARAAAGVAALEKLEPRLDVPGLGFDVLREAGDVEAPLREAEAWVGPADLLVAPLVAKHQAAVAAFHGRARAAIEAKKKALPPPGQPFRIASLGLTARVMKDAAVTLEVTPSGSSASFTSLDVAGAVWFLSARGDALESLAVGDVPQDGAPPERITLKAGEKRTLRLRAMGGGVPDLLRADDVVVRCR